MPPRTGRPKLPIDEKRVPANALVSPETIDLLDRYAFAHRISRGKAIDLAAKTLKKPKRAR